MKRARLVTALAVALFAVASSSSVRGAGSNAGEEGAIRQAIAAYDKGGSTTTLSLPDRIFWSGAYRRPMVGNQKGELITTTDSAGHAQPDRVPGSEKTKTDVIRIVVADSHDLAYEYSKSTLEFDVKGGGHSKFDTGILRVWQKQGGGWKVAAFFVHPYDE